MAPLNPKRRVIRNRVLRRSVTRGVDTLWWAKLERDKKRNMGNNNQEPVESGEGLNGLAVAMFVLFALLFSIITKSC